MLARLLAGHVTATLSAARLETLVVTADGEVAEWADEVGVDWLTDPGHGLDVAAEVGVARAGGGRWVVIHSDLPLLTKAEADVLSEATTGPGPIIGPSSDGGTSVIMSKGPFHFSYGPGSFRRHLARCVEAQVMVATGFLHDLDQPNDLESALAHPRGAWLSKALT